MLNFIKKIFGMTNTKTCLPQSDEPEFLPNVVSDSVSVPVSDTAIKLHAKPTCSFCKCPEHNIAKCPEVLDEMAKIKAYCSEYSNQQNIPATAKWLDQFDEKILNRYVVSSNINNYMWSHCTVYYSNNIEGTKGKKKSIELIIGHDCVLPLHPEIKIQRLYKKKQLTPVIDCNYNNNSNDFSVGAIGAGIVIGTGIATGFAVVNMID
jgi:hypothetical protein